MSEFDRRKLPISSIMRYLWGYEPPSERTGPEYRPQTPGGFSERRNPSLLEDIVSRTELEAAQALSSPGPGSIGAVRTPPPNLVSNQLKQLNKIIEWLNEAGIYSTVNRRPTGTSYINTQHPITREQHTIRVPQDTHYGSPIQQGETRRIGSSSVSLAGSNIANTARPGYYFDTGSSILNTNRLPRSELIGNVRGEPFADLNVLFDALANTYSRAPVSHRRGNWLVEPGREPHRGHRTTPVPMTNPPIMWGTRFTANNNPPVSALRKREAPRTLTEEQLELALEGIEPRRNILKLKKK